MENNDLDIYLRDLKFIVIADAKTRKPFNIYFGFDLPNLHASIFEEAERLYSKRGIAICVQGGGRITKSGNYIVFHGTSEKYKRYEDNVVLALANEHATFKDKGFIFISKAGQDNVSKIIEDYNNNNHYVKQ